MRNVVMATIIWFASVAAAVAAGEPAGSLYVVGMGPAGPDLTAPRVLSIIEQADYFLCSPRLPQRFPAFGIDPDKIAFNPWEDPPDDDAPAGSPLDSRAWRRQRVQDFVLEKIYAGKTVVMMDGGDPCVYAPTLGNLLVGLDDRYYEVVPGMGAFNAAAAALKRSMTCAGARFVLLTSPRSLFDDAGDVGDIVEDLARYPATLVFYMALEGMADLVQRFRRHFPDDLPVAIVYFAGYPDREFVLRSTLTDIVRDMAPMDETWLGLVVMGECVR